MVSAQANILIARPPASVFRFVADDFFANYPRWSPEVTSLQALTPGPIRVGSLGRQVRIDLGRRTECTFRVTVLEEPSRLEFVETRQRFSLGYLLEAAEDQTRLTFEFELMRLELHLRPFLRLIRSAVRAGAERTVQNIKCLVEREVP